MRSLKKSSAGDGNPAQTPPHTCTYFFSPSAWMVRFSNSVPK
ncbi:hypothetical protein QW060_27365 [Myroides ceti]|uniref:Uncharacterized protein n=1 Tax=Paenimyroides ceti TaxID=395087 RepID=A0ABT8D290_9FLAO|nr:hypothetical protein [Paenimyroides ceti]MDN3710516.1 hypothetical protein [Paenimyroides ceti]